MAILLQVLVGINATTFNANPLNPSTTRYTIAQSMTGVTAEDILNLVATDVLVTPTRRSLMGALAATTVPSITLTYIVSAGSSTMSASQLYAQLYDVVVSGAFTTALYDSAVFFGAPSLMTVSSSTVTYVGVPDDVTDDTTKDNNDNDGGSDDALSTAEVIGIAVAGGFVAFLLGGALVYMFMRRPSETMASQHGGSSA